MSDRVRVRLLEDVVTPRGIRYVKGEQVMLVLEDGKAYLPYKGGRVRTLFWEAV